LAVRAPDLDEPVAPLGMAQRREQRLDPLEPRAHPRVLAAAQGGQASDRLGIGHRRASSSEGATPQARPRGGAAPAEPAPGFDCAGAAGARGRRRRARAPGVEGTRSHQLATDPAGPGGAQPPRGTGRVPRGPAIPGARARRPRCAAIVAMLPRRTLAGPGRLAGEEREDAAEGLLELAPVDDEVDLTVLKQELRALEPFGQGLADRLGDHARPREADQRARLGEDDVAEHREARRDATRRRIGQHRDVRQPALAETFEGRGGLGHLHEREDPFLHAGAARRGDDDDRQVLVDGELDRARELLTDDRPHTAAEESELEHAQHARHAADPGHSGDDRLVGLRLLHGGADAVAVFLGVPEAERVRGLQIGVALFERARVRQAPDAPALEQVMTTLGDYNLTLSGSFNAAMKSPTSCTSVGESARSSIRRTMAEPTITPSASRPTAATWSGLAIPNPTQTGFVVRRLSV